MPCGMSSRAQTLARSNARTDGEFDPIDSNLTRLVQKLGHLDDDLIESFHWRLASIVVVSVLWAVLLFGTLFLTTSYLYDFAVSPRPRQHT